MRQRTQIVARAISLASVALLALSVTPRRAPAQDTLSGAAQDTLSAALAKDTLHAARLFPFGAGESITYDVRFGPIRVGSATMQIVGVDSVRGRDAWHIIFGVKGRALFYAVDDRHESWVDTSSLASLRFEQKIKEGRYRRHRRYEIYPDRAVYTDGGEVEHASVSDPLDDGSFLYFVRTLPLVVGETYEFDRYFRPDRNPVTIRVLRRERITVPAGTFETVVVQPIIKTRGIFAEKGEAQVWLSADDARIVVQVKAKLSFGTLGLELKSYRRGAPDPASVTAVGK
jgi:hypothetical protein